MEANIKRQLEHWSPILEVFSNLFLPLIIIYPYIICI